ncbi:hypothetical protein AKJ62_00290 [candidate division MSBL1 archaeon SCGC-AAA259D14]|uniref:Electron transfer flavoprotein alpha/beta-subunit N-terminal domain-containing protein n=2 Tax=candidate division MSBL1 TaxID=215777 RepID=A0A133U8W8_9EURY|nr:hypothetical protein AKJ62_00290 [candidate division MSBL1 archaeon SCGC-AAA259D14]KXA93838.1 hypothetical protein AKJ66_00690 [candidate division MSBL1 archaeon SCGC-AAA259E22]
MVLVLVEHRQGEIRDITFEMLTKAAELADETDSKVSAVLLTDDADGFIDELKPWADEILLHEDPKYEFFNSDVYEQALVDIIADKTPDLIMIGHSAQGMELAPSLASETDIPLVTSVIDMWWEDGELVSERQIYGGKVNSEVRYNKKDPYMVTVQAASFEAEEAPNLDGSIIEIDPSIDDSKVFKKFLEYVEPEAGEVDITASEILISIGRGIGEEDNLDIIEELAEAVGGDISGSRPVIDNGWLPDDRQVGQSGKTVTPKLYLAIGISGASQHIIGMKGSETIVAINKDPDAPIFEVADYGIVDDLFDIVPKLTETIKEEYQ